MLHSEERKLREKNCKVYKFYEAMRIGIMIEGQEFFFFFLKKIMVNYSSYPRGYSVMNNGKGGF